MSNDTPSLPQADSSSKEVTLTPALTALLKPTAEYLGGELKARIAQKVDALRERQKQANLRAHLEKVTQAPGLQQSAEGDIRQLSLFREWVDGAQNVPPTEKALASMWQELLTKILNGINFEEKLMHALAQLSEADAVLLLKFARNSRYRPKNGRERYILSQGNFSNLIGTSTVSQVVYSILAVVSFLVIVAVVYFQLSAVGNAIDAVSAGAPLAMMAKILPQMTGIIAIGGAVALGVWRFIPSCQLTWFGSELLRHACPTDREIDLVENEA